MKQVNDRKTRRKGVFLVVSVVLVLIASLLFLGADQGDLFPGFAAQQEEVEGAEGVILVPIDYQRGRWTLGDGGPAILGCEPPTSFSKPHESGPLARLLDKNGEAIDEYRLRMDPRIILHEGPSADPFLLEEVATVLRIPLSGEPVVMEFYASPDPVGTPEEKELVLRVDLAEALEQFKEEGPRNGDCDEPEFQPDALEK